MRSQLLRQCAFDSCATQRVRCAPDSSALIATVSEGSIRSTALFRLKQERRDLYQDALGLFSRRSPNVCFSEKRNGGDYEVKISEARDLSFTKDYPQPVTVVRSEENVTKNHYEGKKLVAETTAHEWLWISTLNPKVFFATQVRMLVRTARLPLRSPRRLL